MVQGCNLMTPSTRFFPSEPGVSYEMSHATSSRIALLKSSRGWTGPQCQSWNGLLACPAQPPTPLLHWTSTLEQKVSCGRESQLKLNQPGAKFPLIHPSPNAAGGDGDRVALLFIPPPPPEPVGKPSSNELSPSEPSVPGQENKETGARAHRERIPLSASRDPHPATSASTERPAVCADAGGGGG